MTNKFNCTVNPYIDANVVTLMNYHHIFFTALYLKFDDHMRITDDHIFKFGTQDNMGFETTYNSTSHKLEFSCKNSTGAVYIHKIIIQGVSGETTQNADWREFEFIGLGQYQDGNRMSIMNVTTTLNTYQYPYTPVMTPNDWVSGGKERYSYNGTDNSLYLQGTQVISSSHNFTFNFTGGSYPDAANFTELKIYFDRPEFGGATPEEGVWDFIIEDQNGVQHTMISSFTISDANEIVNTQYAYVEFNTGITYPQLQPAVTDIYDIARSDGKLNLKQELLLSSAGVKFSDGTIQTTAGGAGSYTDADARAVVSASCGTGLVWNSGNNQIDCSIVNTDVDVSDANLNSKLSTRDGTGLSWNSTTNKMDCSITQYANADVISFLETQQYIGLGTPSPSVALEVYDNADIKSRLYSYTGNSDYQIVCGNDGDIARLLLSERSDEGYIGKFGFDLQYDGSPNQFSINRYNNNFTSTRVLTINRTDGEILLSEKLKLSSAGILFNDGTTMTTASSGGGGGLGNTVGTWHASSEGKNRIYFMSNTNTYLTSVGTSGGLYLQTNEGYSTRLLIRHSGYCEINTSSGYSGSQYGRPYWGYSNTSIYTSSYNFPTSLITNQAIRTGTYFITTSDSRIKKDIEDLDDEECLNKLLQLKPKKYKYLDTYARGEGVTYGFIAQDVENILPEMVKTTHGHLPNIYYQYTFNDNVCSLDNNDKYTPVLNHKLKIIDGEENISYFDIIEIIDNLTFKISNDTGKILSGEFFIYGYEVNDFKNLNKDHFHAITISSVQELHKKIQEQQTQINQLLEILARNNIS